MSTSYKIAFERLKHDDNLFGVRVGHFLTQFSIVTTLLLATYIFNGDIDDFPELPWVVFALGTLVQIAFVYTSWRHVNYVAGLKGYLKQENSPYKSDITRPGIGAHQVIGEVLPCIWLLFNLCIVLIIIEYTCVAYMILSVGLLLIATISTVRRKCIKTIEETAKNEIVQAPANN